MRLREPFQGYKLSSGHVMFHMAYLLGSYIATVYSMKDPFQGQKGSQDVLLQLNLAHIFTPILTVVGGIFNQNGFYVLEKICDTVSIFQYQATIFYAQWYQMQSGEATKLSGINVWFIIEILSFYGYILAAILFILENQI